MPSTGAASGSSRPQATPGSTSKQGVLVRPRELPPACPAGSASPLACAQPPLLTVVPSEPGCGTPVSSTPRAAISARAGTAKACAALQCWTRRASPSSAGSDPLGKPLAWTRDMNVWTTTSALTNSCALPAVGKEGCWLSSDPTIRSILNHMQRSGTAAAAPEQAAAASSAADRNTLRSPQAYTPLTDWGCRRRQRCPACAEHRGVKQRLMMPRRRDVCRRPCTPTRQRCWML